MSFAALETRTVSNASIQKGWVSEWQRLRLTER
jgi:hypothetical protein